MKKLTALLLIISALLIISCSVENKNTIDYPKQVVVSGKVLNFSMEWQKIALSVNRIGFNQQKIEVPLDSQGNFSVTFDTYIPTDVWVSYRNNFLILAHPGDSIYLEFDGTPKNKDEILKTVIFKGDNVKSNQDAIAFQKAYFLDAQNSTDSIYKVIKEFDIIQFRYYLDNSRKKFDALFETFVSEFNPNEETKLWISEFLNVEIYNRMFSYPFFHQSLNNLEYNNNLYDIPADYFNPIMDRKSISKFMFISGAALTTYFRYFISSYKRVYIINGENMEIQMNAATLKASDSLIVNGILDYSKDSLFTQLALTTLFSGRITMESDIEYFEKYKNVIEDNIKEPYLKEPLFELYMNRKQELERQRSNSENVQEVALNINSYQILDSIISVNKGKVIYLDCWATWCGPCKAEMPNSKALMKEMKNIDVGFAFLCLHSDIKDWQETIEKFHFGGQHYFLPKDQSIDFAKYYAINGVPNYMLIDKKGNIVEQGTHLRPNVVKVKIEELLKE